MICKLFSSFLSPPLLFWTISSDLQSWLVEESIRYYIPNIRQCLMFKIWFHLNEYQPTNCGSFINLLGSLATQGGIPLLTLRLSMWYVTNIYIYTIYITYIYILLFIYITYFYYYYIFIWVYQISPCTKQQQFLFYKSFQARNTLIITMHFIDHINH